MSTETVNFLQFLALGTVIILAINVLTKKSISVSRFPKMVLIVDLETDVFRLFLNHLFRYLMLFLFRKKVFHFWYFDWYILKKNKYEQA